MLEFGRIFGTPTVSAYTWGIAKQKIGANIPAATKEADIKKKLDQYKDYVVGDLPAANVVATQAKLKPQSISIVICYGTADGSKATEIPIPSREEKNHKPWRAATAKTIAAKDAEAIEENNKLSPVASFEFVTVTP